MTPCLKARSVKTLTFDEFVLPDVRVTRHSRMGVYSRIGAFTIYMWAGVMAILTKMYPGSDPGLMVRAIIQAAPRPCGELAYDCLVQYLRARVAWGACQTIDRNYRSWLVRE